MGFSFHGGRALPAIHGIVITDPNFNLFQAEYKNKLVESFKSDAVELEKQIAQKWMKIIKNALIARRLKHDSSFSLSESLIPSESIQSKLLDDENISNLDHTIISAFNPSVIKINQESEIEEFDAI